jgi:phosphatidylserine/phosphatidylglycerophosphate/cardiolipin synthase-like enzyme
MTNRLIHRSAASPSRDIAECLQGLLVSELLSPGKRFIVVSPYMSDFPAIDNRADEFASLDSAWPSALVPFSKVIRALLTRGVAVRIASGPGDREADLRDRLQQGAAFDGTLTKLSLYELPRDHKVFSHEKALVADTWAIYGSMNLTFRGVTMNGELITVTTDPNTVATAATALKGL